MNFTVSTTNESHLGDEETFKAVFDAHYRRLVLFANSFLLDLSAAEDIVQTIFLNLWQKGFDNKSASSIQAYLYAAVKNRCLNEIRDQNVRDTHNLRYVQAMLNVWEDGEDSQVLLEELKKSISKLPEQVRHTIELRYFQGKSVSETAGILNVSENTVKTQIRRGRATLKLALSEVRLKIFFLLVTLLAE